MTVLLWCLPAILIAGAIASGRLTTTAAAGLGLAVALPIAAWAGPVPLDGSAFALALARGAWVGANLAPYILGGLLFWGVVHGSRSAPPPDGSAMEDGSEAARALPEDERSRRRRLAFHACFVVGPFAEALTGFGVGMLGTLALVRGLDLRPRHAMVLALLSQTMIPWGAMGSGTLLAATFAGLTPTELAMRSLLPSAALTLVWLPLFWRTAADAGLGAGWAQRAREVAWMAVCCGALGVATQALGPEVGMLAAYGPLIVLRGVVAGRRSGARPADSPSAVAMRLAPHAVLITLLVSIRLVPAWRDAALAFGRLQPWPDLPGFAPLFHGGACMLWVALATALLRRRPAASHGTALHEAARAAWGSGKHATLTVLLFAMLAELLARAGISQGLAAGILAALDRGALVAMPLAAGLFGVLSNSTNPSSTLFMPPQVALAAQAAVAVPLAATLLHVTACTLCLASPVRMSIAANLAWGRGEERAVYARLLPFVAAALAVLGAYATWVLWPR